MKNSGIEEFFSCFITTKFVSNYFVNFFYDQISFLEFLTSKFTSIIFGIFFIIQLQVIDRLYIDAVMNLHHQLEMSSPNGYVYNYTLKRTDIFGCLLYRFLLKPISINWLS